MAALLAGAGGVARAAGVRRVQADGEERVHGSRAPWLALAGEDWTLVFVAGDDPWFVRVAQYPGVGTALAWDTPLDLRGRAGPGVSVVVADGPPASVPSARRGGRAPPVSAEVAL